MFYLKSNLTKNIIATCENKNPDNDSIWYKLLAICEQRAKTL